MVYALTITIVVAVVLLALIGGVALFAQRLASGERGRVIAWRWQPSWLGYLALLLLPVAAIALWRFFPLFLFLPIIIPFFWRWRGGANRTFYSRRRRGRRASSNGHSADGGIIEGQSQPVDDE